MAESRHQVLVQIFITNQFGVVTKRKIWAVLPGRRWWGRRRSSRSTCSSPPGRMSPLLGASPLPGFLICISINIIFSFTFIFNLYSVQHPTADGWPTRSKRWSWRTRFARTRSSTTTGSGGPHTRRREATPARDRFNIIFIFSFFNIRYSLYILYIQYLILIQLFQGGVPAFVGFNAGNGTKSFAYMPYSQVLRCFLSFVSICNSVMFGTFKIKCKST